MKFKFDWEREWRVLSDITFTYEDVAFVVIKKNEEIKSFCKQNGLLYLYYDQNPDEILDHFAKVVRSVRST